MVTPDPAGEGEGCGGLNEQLPPDAVALFTAVEHPELSDPSIAVP
jgi:hypothetical protein